MSFRQLFSNLVLLPVSRIYGAVTFMRNQLFDWHILPQHEFGVPVVVVGNLAVGGTGKTPHTEYIVESLRHNYHIAVLSRGYKRSTKGFVMATPHSKPGDIGDESYQMYKKFGHKVTVAVCEDRVHGINELLRLDPKINLIVLDDAFQHRYVRPAVSVVITEYQRPLYQDKILPYGRLREPLRGINRADIVVVSKCPENMSDLDYALFRKNLNLFPYQDVFFSRYAYQSLVPLFPDNVGTIPSLEWMDASDSILAVAGIDNPRPFIRHLKSFLPKVRVNIFGDHHNFSRKDLEMLLQRFQTMKGRTRILVTTEKDAVRLAANPYFPPELRPYAFYLPVKVQFVQHGKSDFDSSLARLIKNGNT